MISVCFQSKAFNITEIQDYAPSTNAKEAEAEQFDEDIQDPLELAPSKKKKKRKEKTNKQKNVLFMIGDWNAKVRGREALGITVWPWSTKLNRAKTNRVLPREYIGHSKHLLPTAKQTTLHMDITRWSIPKSD